MGVGRHAAGVLVHGVAANPVFGEGRVDARPARAETGRDKDYEWQGRVYMWLWDVDEFEIAYCMVSTPQELIGYERDEIHYVDHINPLLRITRVPYMRDKVLEDRIKFKVEAANVYLESLIKQIAEEHQ